ncbi:hypothetical protein FV113G1_15360 [Fusobacterium varium]|nr:hypothetical protein FV113G1_15360 [Fusobacterium varium]
MVEKILGRAKSSNQKRGINVAIGVVIGCFLIGGIGYSQEEVINKKTVYDEEIKWLWPFEKGSSKKKLEGNTGGEVLPPEPEIIPPKKDEIPWQHDPDGVIEDGLEQDSTDIYTGILKREWNKEKEKWEVVGLQDENKDGIADIYDPDGDFDGDGIKNKDDKNWALNAGKQNDLFISSNGLGYVDSGSIVRVLKENDWNADKIKNYLYSKGQLDLYKNGIKNLEDTDIKTITKLNKYNEKYNKENKIINSNDGTGEFENKLKEIEQNKLDEYNNFTGGTNNLLYNDIATEITGQNIREKDNIQVVNKGKINFTRVNPGQLGAKSNSFKAYNYGEIIGRIDLNGSGEPVSNDSIGQKGMAESNHLYNYGVIDVEIKIEGGYIGSVGQRIDNNMSYSKSVDNEIINYGYIKSINTGGGAAAGQDALATGGLKIELINSGKIYAEVNGAKSGNNGPEIVGQRIHGSNTQSSFLDINADIYNYNDIKLVLKQGDDGINQAHYLYGQKATIALVPPSTETAYLNSQLYNYGNIKIEDLDGKLGETGFLYGQYAETLNQGTDAENKTAQNNVYNYGNIDIISKGTTTSYGQRAAIKYNSINIRENQLYNYGKINISSENKNYGQFLTTWSTKEFFKSDIYNYGIIISEGKGTIGQSIEGYKGTANNYGQIRVKGGTKDTAGIKVIDGAIGFNYGMIEVDNKGIAPENMGTGMWADGKDSEAFNYGSIIVTGLTGTVENGMDTAYMRATNGGKVYNYGWLELKDSLDALTIGEGVSSSTRAGYRSAGDFDLKGEMKIMAETGKGDIYSKENFITAGGNGKEGNISGLENLTSSGVYEIFTTERKGDNGENIVDLVMNKTKNIEDLEKDSNTGRMVKELQLDNAVYGKDSEFARNNKEFSEMISRKVSEGESLENLLGLEYANLNGQIIESGKVLLENQEKVMSTDRTYLSGQFNKENNFDAVVINPQNESKIGIFHLNSDKDLDSQVSGTYRYELESTTLILQNNKNYMIGMNYSKLDYKNRNSDMKKTSVFAGHNYIKSLSDISEYRNYINGTLTFNTMDRNGKRDDFKSYDLNMRNEYVRELDIEGLTYSEFTAGVKTTVFGHEKIKEHGADLTSDRNIEVKKKIGISNEINLGFLMNKSYEIGENKRKNNFGISTYLGYKKELMPINDWRDEFTIGTGNYAKYNKPVKEHDLGVGLGVVSARYEIKDELSGTLSFSADTLGDTMTTFKIEYKF